MHCTNLRDRQLGVRQVCVAGRPPLCTQRQGSRADPRPCEMPDLHAHGWLACKGPLQLRSVSDLLRCLHVPKAGWPGDGCLYSRSGFISQLLWSIVWSCHGS